MKDMPESIKKENNRARSSSLLVMSKENVNKLEKNSPLTSFLSFFSGSPTKLLTPLRECPDSNYLDIPIVIEKEWDKKTQKESGIELKKLLKEQFECDPLIYQGSCSFFEILEHSNQHLRDAMLKDSYVDNLWSFVLLNNTERQYNFHCALDHLEKNFSEMQKESFYLKKSKKKQDYQKAWKTFIEEYVIKQVNIHSPNFFYIKRNKNTWLNDNQKINIFTFPPSGLTPCINIKIYQDKAFNCLKDSFLKDPEKEHKNFHSFLKIFDNKLTNEDFQKNVKKIIKYEDDNSIKKMIFFFVELEIIKNINEKNEHDDIVWNNEKKLGFIVLLYRLIYSNESKQIELLNSLKEGTISLLEYLQKRIDIEEINLLLAGCQTEDKLKLFNNEKNDIEECMNKKRERDTLNSSWDIELDYQLCTAYQEWLKSLDHEAYFFIKELWNEIENICFVQPFKDYDVMNLYNGIYGGSRTMIGSVYGLILEEFKKSNILLNKESPFSKTLSSEKILFYKGGYLLTDFLIDFHACLITLIATIPPVKSWLNTLKNESDQLTIDKKQGASIEPSQTKQLHCIRKQPSLIFCSAVTEEMNEIRFVAVLNELLNTTGQLLQTSQLHQLQMESIFTPAVVAMLGFLHIILRDAQQSLPKISSDIENLPKKYFEIGSKIK